MINREDLITVGKFQKTHALKGELNMLSDIDPEYFMEGNPMIIEIDGILVPFYLNSVRSKGSTSYLVKIDDVDDEKRASEFVNKEIYIRKKDAEEWLGEEILDTNEFIGYTIINSETGDEIGVLKDIDDSTANLLFIVESEEGTEIYLPANNDFIDNIDENKKTIHMTLPTGLLDLE